MKRVFAMVMAIIAIVGALAVPASAATTMKWNWNSARKSISSAIGQIVQKETKP